MTGEELGRAGGRDRGCSRCVDVRSVFWHLALDAQVLEALGSQALKLTEVRGDALVAHHLPTAHHGVRRDC